MPPVEDHPLRYKLANELHGDFPELSETLKTKLTARIKALLNATIVSSKKTH